MSSNLLLQRDDDVLSVRLNRPQKRNALSFELLLELRDLARDLRRDRKLRAVILSGEGESFSAGIDLDSLADPARRFWAFWQLLKPGRSVFQDAFLAWRDLPVPVIAAIHGHCFGAGLQLALAADLRIGHPAAQLSIMESRWGLVPDMGLTRSLRGLMAIDQIKRLTFSACILDGEQARQLQLLTALDPDPQAAALDQARQFAERSPDALAAAKQVIEAMHTRSEGAALRLEKRWQLKLLLGRNAAIARARGKDPQRPYRPRQY